MSIRISSLPAAGELTGSELMPVLQDGVTKAAGTNQFLKLASSASNVVFAPTSTISATNVQLAIEELDNKKAPLDSPAFTGTVTGITKDEVGLGDVDNTSDADKPISTAQQAALDLKANSENPVFTGTVTGVTKAAVGLGNADNTSDANKPVSGPQQTALDLKADLASPTFTGNVSGITKSMVGLGDVDNTSDANKPVSTAQAAAFVAKTSSTGTAVIPAGTEAQRDASPAIGAIRYSSTLVGWEGWNGTNWVSIGGGQMLGNALVKAISYNSQTIAENLTIATGTNGFSAGPVTVTPGYTVTISPGTVWRIV